MGQNANYCTECPCHFIRRRRQWSPQKRKDALLVLLLYRRLIKARIAVYKKVSTTCHCLITVYLIEVC